MIVFRYLQFTFTWFFVACVAQSQQPMDSADHWQDGADIGQCFAGVPVRGNIAFGPFESDRHVARLEVSCGCTKASFTPSTVEANKPLTIPVGITPPGAGDFSTKVRLTHLSKDGNDEAIEVVHIHGTARQRIVVESERVEVLSGVAKVEFFVADPAIDPTQLEVRSRRGKVAVTTEGRKVKTTLSGLEKMPDSNYFALQKGSDLIASHIVQHHYPGKVVMKPLRYLVRQKGELKFYLHGDVEFLSLR